MRRSASLFSGSTIVPTFTGPEHHRADGVATVHPAAFLARDLRK
jgi:hypothetical protein